MTRAMKGIVGNKRRRKPLPTVYIPASDVRMIGGRPETPKEYERRKAAEALNGGES